MKLLRNVCVVLGIFSSTSLWAKPEVYELDNDHSFAIFSINHLGVSTTIGRFNDKKGSLVFDSEKPENSKIDFTIMTESVDTHNQKRDDHLRGPDFFNAKQFPVMSFKSKSIKSTGKDTYDVSGEIMIHGTKKDMSFSVQKIGEGKDPWGGYRMGGIARFKIKRSDFGMNFMVGPVADEVDVTFAFEGIKK